MKNKDDIEENGKPLSSRDANGRDRDRGERDRDRDRSDRDSGRDRDRDRDRRDRSRDRDRERRDAGGGEFLVVTHGLVHLLRGSAQCNRSCH